MNKTCKKLKNGNWQLCVDLGYDEIQKKRIRKYRNVKASGLREAKDLLEKFADEFKKDEKYKPITIEEFSIIWMKDYVEKNLKKKTISDYKDILERIVFCLGHKKLTDLKPTHLIEFYNLLSSDGIRKDGKPGGLSPKTIKHYHLVISSMLNTAYQWELIEENVCDKVRLPKIKKKKVTTLSIEEAKQIMTTLNKEPLKYRLIIMIAIFSGFRRGEIMGLVWDDLNFKENSITVERTSSYTADFGIFEDDTKTDYSNRTCYLPQFVMDMFKTYKDEWNSLKEKCGDQWHETNRIFTQWNGKDMSPDTVSSWFPKFIRRNKLPYPSFHGLRHAHGSIFLALGLDPASVADQLGHANLQMLFQTYGHSVRKNSKEVAEFMSKALLDD